MRSFAVSLLICSATARYNNRTLEAFLGSACKGVPDPVTESLNKQIVSGSYIHKGFYEGGKGVIVRTPDFFSGGNNVVVPATFWVNDITVPNMLYPAGNPWCPHSNSDGYESLNWITCDGHGGDKGPWSFATVAAVIGEDGMRKLFKNFDQIQDKDWGWGVFYASDANAADKRCRNLASLNGFDCPGTWIPYQGQSNKDPSKKGAGNYQPGNPYAGGGGGGAGCHFDSGTHVIDQTDAWAGSNNLVQDGDCQCNYAFDKDWNQWVSDWIQHTKQKPGFESRKWLAGGGGRAPAWAIDTAICWVNNPRDMINIQNALWKRHSEWLNGAAPHWGWTTNNIAPYWGWNEVPVSRTIVDDYHNWDAIMIKLPAGMHSVSQLGSGETVALEGDLATWAKQGKMIPGAGYAGKKPGSYVVFVREVTFSTDGYYRQFYCENWNGPQKWYKILFHKPDLKLPGGECYIDAAQSNAVTMPSVLV